VRLVALSDADAEPRGGARVATLGDTTVTLLGAAPRAGSRLTSAFAIPAARRADAPLTRGGLARGLAFVSTLPNIAKHACVAQIVALEEHGAHWFPRATIAHVSADDARHWAEVDLFHGAVRAAGYSLAAADPCSAATFARAFGVAVAGHRRVAHGLFALRDGVFLDAEIPGDQLSTPQVEAFLARVHERLAHDPLGTTTGSQILAI
jgi:hypothetical protein